MAPLAEVALAAADGDDALWVEGYPGALVRVMSYDLHDGLTGEVVYDLEARRVVPRDEWASWTAVADPAPAAIGLAPPGWTAQLGGVQGPDGAQIVVASLAVPEGEATRLLVVDADGGWSPV
ncbi:MAG: hypothetical protein ABMB14_20330, partial [Myxococcota bacterium]